VLTPGTRVGEFEVLAPLGAGGMGEVYRARDPRLEREVALKVLPATTETDDTARKRLLREARLASKLNHPNICTIYEVGEAEGQAHIAMELVSGNALSERLANQRMRTDEVLRLGRQMAGALAHAHDNGVVHRDFKSGNVVITPEGRAKVLDFGLAARVGDQELTEATTYSVDSLELSGKIVGTLAYMAPEQLRGEAADARSDIWALGVVLYEMASGVRPFKGRTGFELSSAIFSATPEPLPPGLGGAIPTQLQMVIDRCLEKDPVRRYQNAGEVRAALETARSTTIGTTRSVVLPAMPGRRWLFAVAGVAVVLAVLAVLDVGGMRRLLLGGGSGQVRAIRMAVLPFVNLSGDSEQEYLSDGFTQEMITQLGRLHPQGLSVIARTSVMRYKGGDTPIDQIGRELSVDYVLEGSTHREEGRIRIAADLVYVGDQTQLWADSYERELAGILVVQSEVAQRVAEALALELLPAERARLAAARPVDPEAHEAYLRGIHQIGLLTPEGLKTAKRYFELALEKDPEFSPAYAGLTRYWMSSRQMAIVDTEVAGREAKAVALKAVELDDNSAEARAVLASVKTWADWDWVGAETEWLRALELDPNHAATHNSFSHFLAITGRLEEAIQHGERALELDPFNAKNSGFHTVTLYFNRRYDDALAAADATFAIQPDQWVASWTRQYVYFSKGMHDELLNDQRQRVTQDSEAGQVFEKGLAEGGFEGAQRAIADLAVERRETSGGNLPSSSGIARFYLWAGDHEKAIHWLERAYEDRNPDLPYLGMPLYDPIRSDPRFVKLARRMGLPHAAEPISDNQVNN